MASITMIKDITPTKRNAVLKIRSLVSWRQARNYKNKSPPTLEIILIDEEGDKIQASLQNNSIELYENVLTYGTTALISNFNVAANGATNKGTTGLATTHKFKIWFLPSTVVKVINNFVGPVHGFKFASFSNIQAKKELKDEDVVDIIGCITKVGDIQSFENKKNGTQNVRVTTHLMDSRSVIINCTLFGELAKSLIDLISKQDPDRPIVLIVQFGKIKEFSDEFTVTNRFEGTRIYVNDDIEEINEFLTSYDGESGVGKIEPATQSMSTIGPDFYLDCEHILLADITDSQEGSYVSLATIDSIHFEDGWFYSACKKHNKKVFPLNEVELMKVKNPGNGLKCPTCGHNPQSLFPKFMLNVRVANDTGSASLKLMDRHVKEMLGMSAYDLRKKYLAYDDDVIPEELDDIIGKQYLFKIQVSQYNIEHKYYIYTVDELTDDGDTIAQFKNTYHIDDGVTDDNITVSTDVMSPTFVSSQDVVSATGDNYGVLDLTTSTTTDSPHGKRKHIDCDPASVNTSSTKLKRRNVKFIVEEDE